MKKGDFAYNKSYSVGYDYGSIKRLDRYEDGVVSTLYNRKTKKTLIATCNLHHIMTSKIILDFSHIGADGT